MENFNLYNIKNSILEASKKGFYFYKHFIPELTIGSNNTSCRSVKNPFYEDKRASLSIYNWNNQWRFKDFGDDSYSGNVFDFAAHYYKLDPINDIELLLNKMQDEIFKFGTKTMDAWRQPMILNTDNSFFEISFSERKSIDFTTEELNYWMQYGIDGATLDAQWVVAVDGYTVIHDDELPPISKNRPFGSMWFAYRGNNYGKIYCPNPKRFWYVGQKPHDYVFGTPFNSYSEKKDVILTGGEKDSLTLIAHGFNAITLNSETAEFTPNLLRDLYQSNMRITGVLYDLDETGIKRGKELAGSLKCPVITLPPWLLDKGGKDVSDFFRLGGEASDLLTIINEAEPYLEPSTSTVRRRVRTAQQRLEDAKNQPTIYKILDVFLHSGELAILFGDTGIGKSLLAVAIADAASRGVSFLNLENQCQPQKVIYYDFELSDKQFEKRYSNEDGQPHSFDPNFFTDNVDFSEFVVDRANKFDKMLLDKIRADVKDVEANFIIIDNITYLNSQTSSDVQIAMEIMKQLKQLKDELQVTILVLAHTPKRPASKPLTINELAGSKQLSNFADSVFAFGVCSTDRGFRYLKQVKPSRSGDHKFDENNVLKCELLRDENDDTFLTFKYVQCCEESDLLAPPMDDKELKAEAQRILAATPGTSYREIAAQLGVSKSTVGRWLKPS